MLPKKNKLPIQLFKKRSSELHQTESFGLKVFKNSDNKPHDESRFGVIISNKVFKKATKRNALKRSVFSYLGEIISKIPEADYLIITRPGIIRLEKPEIKKELEKLFKDL